MRIRKRLRRSTKQYIIVAFICIVVIGGAASLTTILLTSQIRDEYKLQLQEAYVVMESNQRDVYIAVTDIYAGDAITEDKLERRRVYSSQPINLYLTGEDIGRTAIIDIPAQTQVLTAMLTDEAVTSELRELEYSVININSNIEKKDTVDIRLFYPNGESYVVLSKKMLKDFIPETASCYLWLDEEELLRMSAAIVDASLYTGSYLYVTRYIEPNIQEASIVNYTPSLSILSLLETDPNILIRATQELSREIRKRLENRLAMSMDVDVSQISWDVHPNVSSVINPDFTSPYKPASEVNPILKDNSLSENNPASKDDPPFKDNLMFKDNAPSKYNSTSDEKQSSDDKPTSDENQSSKANSSSEESLVNDFDSELGIAVPSGDFSYFEVRAKERDIGYGE